MQYIKSEVSKQAKELGYITDTFEKVLRLISILKFINQNKFLNALLVLKGGTAINLLLSNMPRLSVDIDFDYNSDNMSLDRDKITDTIKKYIASGGYELNTKSKFTPALDSFVFSYINSSGNKDNMKIEINYVLRKHILAVENHEVIVGADSFMVCMLNKDELYATKITALLNRGAVRDLFDISNMIENKLIDTRDKKLLKKSIIFYSILTNNEDELFKYDNIIKIDLRKVKSDLYPVLRKRELFDLNNAKEKVMSYLLELFVLNEDEQKFISKFYKGEFDLTLLFDDEDIIVRLSKHPMIIWKMNHMRDYIGI